MVSYMYMLYTYMFAFKGFIFALNEFRGSEFMKFEEADLHVHRRRVMCQNTETKMCGVNGVDPIRLSRASFFINH